MPLALAASRTIRVPRALTRSDSSGCSATIPDVGRRGKVDHRIAAVHRVLEGPGVEQVADDRRDLVGIVVG